MIILKFSENNIVTIQKFILHSKFNKVKTLRYVYRIGHVVKITIDTLHLKLSALLRLVSILSKLL